MPYADPAKRTAYAMKWQRENRSARNVIVNRYKKKTNHAAFRNHDARKRYGFKSYESMCAVRNRPCEICGKLAKKMCMDHHGKANEFDGTYRGVLCQQCNTRLGWFESKRDTILQYLERDRQCQQ